VLNVLEGRLPTLRAGAYGSSQVGLGQGLFWRKVITIALLTSWLWLSLGLLGWPAIAQPRTAATAQATAQSTPAIEDITKPNSAPDLTGADAISAETVSQFVNAYLAVLALINQREEELRSAETESESKRIERDIEAEAFDLIEQAGLSQETYLQLLGLANSDPEFGDRVVAQLQEVGVAQ